MASLKEIRARISSVSSTQKLTSAMKMVSAAKLHKSEEATLKFVPYKNKLSDMLSQYLSSVDTEKINITLAEKREVKKVAIICISSCTGLCGTFNSNINKLLEKTIKEYSFLPEENILLYPIGKKISDYIKKTNRVPQCSADELSAKPTYEDAIAFISPLVDKFINKEIDKIKEIKRHKKAELAAYVQEKENVTLNPDSIFDIQVKRLHEYKRQFLNILHVMYLYNQIKDHPEMSFYPRTFIFGAKAAAGYRNAKLTIKLINSVADVINNDASINGKIKVVNRGIRNGKPTEAIGKAKTTDIPGQLRVSFFWEFYSDYNILAMGKSGEWALIGSNSPKYLWILSRTPHLSSSTLEYIIRLAQARGYDTDKLIIDND